MQQDMESQTIVFGQSAGLTVNKISLTGHSFTGWATSEDGEVEYADEAEYTIGAGDDTIVRGLDNQPISGTVRHAGRK
jgi:hypothetical protein